MNYTTLSFSPRRRVVERLFGWLDKFRRLWKNCERKLLIPAQILTFALIALSLSENFKQDLRPALGGLFNHAGNIFL